MLDIYPIKKHWIKFKGEMLFLITEGMTNMLLTEGRGIAEQKLNDR